VTKPFIKWAGGKSKLIPTLLEHAPKTFRRYIESFVGGGAMFYAMQPRLSQDTFPALLNDSNTDLITTYSVVRYNLPELVKVLTQVQRGYEECGRSTGFYMGIREQVVAGDSKDARVRRAARFIFLNKTCFNGLYRVNRKGFFNVPHGAFKSPPKICDVETLRAASLALNNVLFSPGDFEINFHTNAEKGDFIYADPPYIPLSTTSDFTGYAKEGFTFEDQKRLRDAAIDASKRGVFVMLSNSGADAARELYADRSKFEVVEVDMRRNINSKGGSRASVKELLIRTKTKGWE
jgi:DNA adenine methylase